jgi:hypothetical protein
VYKQTYQKKKSVPFAVLGEILTNFDVFLGLNHFKIKISTYINWSTEDMNSRPYECKTRVRQRDRLEENDFYLLANTRQKKFILRSAKTMRLLAS